MSARVLRARLRTAGERVELTCAVPRIARVLTEGAAGQLTPCGPAGNDAAGAADPLTVGPRSRQRTTSPSAAPVASARRNASWP